ncbi:MAG TPA: UDP-N-acetylglucosamine 2-epimerase [Candidatus Saccharimonadales bacterium]|nr:UDP-N-acetylglucosamine 2-epimerase [Candidatus Saccharimonadales bacterium]
MIVIFYGTSAELIKLLGIVKTVPRSEQLLVCIAQHEEGLRKLHPQLGIEPDFYLSHGWKQKDVANMKQMLGMMLVAHGNFARTFRKIKKAIQNHNAATGTKSIAVVHGDTVTTVAGSYLGILLGLKVAHVEAGLRSGHWKSPFPEEIDRRIAAKFARVHFPPNKEAEDNLRREQVKGELISTQFNTAKDAIEMSAQFVSEEFGRLKLPKHYCLVLLHRTELLESKADLQAILTVINEHASPKTPVVFTEHTTTKEKIHAYGLDHYLDKPGLTVIPKQPYFDFMAIVGRAEYIVTDGGGLQEDAFFLGIPTMVHRARTERSEGIGVNAELSRMDTQKVASFLRNHRDKKEFSALRHSVSPSQIVVDYFVAHNYIQQSVQG